MEPNNENSVEKSVEVNINQEDAKVHEEEEMELTEFQQEHQETLDPESELKEPNPEQFKKPGLIIGPRKGKSSPISSFSNEKTFVSQQVTGEPEEVLTHGLESEKTEQKNVSEFKLPLSYKEPIWGGKPTGRYKVEVLKSGVILSGIDLTEKSFYIIGRLPVCDIPLAHPTISRYHAILQYRVDGDDKNGPGYYLYDLESTHGTFWNGCRIRPKTYVRLHGGHMLKFGCSQRKFIIQTPADEEEEESEYSVSELKEIRRLQLLEKEKEEKLHLEEEEKLEKMKKEKEETEGINWGMGEDADEETDLTENPYAMTNNEELFLDDPKKTLRGWFEREGYDLQYQTEEKGVGQFLCWVDLPIDTSTSRTVRAEALVKGKKKEAVIQCALEACRVLDRHGLLRQATHEGRKRKSRNWEEEDYYDSDEDNYLDRTGTVERKREQRMRNAGKLEAKAETFTTLVEKHSIVIREISKIEITLKNHYDAKNNADSSSSVDALDAFMSNLSSAVLNKDDVMKLKMKLQELRKEEENLRKLVNIAKPANLPSLNPPSSVPQSKFMENDEIPQKRQCSDDDHFRDCEDNDVEKQQVFKKKQYGLIKTAEAEEEENEKIEDNQDIPRHDEDVDKKLDTEEMEINEDKVNNDNTMITEEAEVTKKKKKNMRRMKQRAEKAEREMQKSANQDAFQENYSTWLPPEDQTGDGKTSLNEKFGY